MKRGFTLIEVMVVLSILAIIAILGYNFFGSTMKEAITTRHAAKLSQDMQMIENAYLEYLRKNSTKPPLTSAAERSAFKDAIVAEGILKAWPTPDPDWRSEDACIDPHSPGGANGWNLAYDNFGGTAATEFQFYLYCVKPEISLRFNELYTNLGYATGNHMNVELVGGRVANCGVAADADCLVLGIGELN